MVEDKHNNYCANDSDKVSDVNSHEEMLWAINSGLVQIFHKFGITISCLFLGVL